ARRGGCRPSRRRRGRGRSSPARSGAGERREARGWSAPDEFRLLLGRRRRGRRVAGWRGVATGAHRILRPPLLRAREDTARSPSRGAAHEGRGVSRVRAFAGFWWDFVVGEDWTVAAGV